MMLYSLHGGAHIVARAVLDINSIWFGYRARLSQWGGGGKLLVQMISTCLRCGRGGGGGSEHPVVCAQSLFMSDAIVQLLSTALVLAMQKIHVLAAL